MSAEGLFVLLPVLLFSLVLSAVIARFFMGRGRKHKRGPDNGNSVQGTILAARILDNDVGSVTQFFPVLDVSYIIEGRTWSAVNLPMARETRADRATVAAVLADRLQPGQHVSLEFDPANHGRVRIA